MKKILYEHMITPKRPKLRSLKGTSLPRARSPLDTARCSSRVVAPLKPRAVFTANGLAKRPGDMKVEASGRRMAMSSVVIGGQVMERRLKKG